MSEYDYRFRRFGQPMDASGKKVVVAIVAFGALLATIAYFGKPIVRLKPQTPRPNPTLAVLPFENLDGDAELELIANDVTVAVTEALEALSEFAVVPREAVLEYKGLPGGIEAIGAALDADFVLAGSVERENDRFRLQAYFVQPGDRPRIWADEFYFDMEKKSTIPGELARHVRGALSKNGGQ